MELRSFWMNLLSFLYLLRSSKARSISSASSGSASGFNNWFWTFLIYFWSLFSFGGGWYKVWESTLSPCFFLSWRVSSSTRRADCMIFFTSTLSQGFWTDSRSLWKALSSYFLYYLGSTNLSFYLVKKSGGSCIYSLVSLESILLIRSLKRLESSSTSNNFEGWCSETGSSQLSSILAILSFISSTAEFSILI